MKCKYKFADGKPSLHGVKSQCEAEINLVKLRIIPSTKYYYETYKQTLAG